VSPCLTPWLAGAVHRLQDRRGAAAPARRQPV